MCEIPWQNVALCILMQEAQKHPEWDARACSWIALRAEECAVEYGREAVIQGDVRQAIQHYEAQMNISLSI